MAEVVPFPIARQRQNVYATADYMLSVSDHAAAKHLQVTVCRKVESLIRRGVAEAVAIQQGMDFATAVRVMMWRISKYETNGGDAA